MSTSRLDEIQERNAEAQRRRLGLDYRDAIQAHLHDIPYLLGLLEEAEVENRWIPVGERLPEKPYGCLVIVEQDDYWGEPREVMYPHFAGYDGEQWNDGDGEKIPLEVTHWMPLPAPPKGE